MLNISSHKFMKFQFLGLAAILFISACAPLTSEIAVETTPTNGPTEENGVFAVHGTPDLEYLAEIEAMRSPNVPDLPFPDNPDPSLCGIPTQWGSDGTAWLKGTYQGELIQSEVLLYDSHLRLNITAQAPHGSEVEVLLFQQNPVTDYYFVKIKDAEPPNEGWIPEHFLSFELIEPIN